MDVDNIVDIGYSIGIILVEVNGVGLVMLIIIGDIDGSGVIVIFIFLLGVVIFLLV